ncbi:MAG TPA: hypothetical protein VN541_01815, partial [Tepidisphaeraceae bacterium]|nr:hypothetical protein [Tepidisphaeraceae bacterium]
AQMNSNYPMVRLTGSTGQVYYARSFNWSSTGVQTGSTPVSTEFALPVGIPSDTYTTNVAVNGFVSAPTTINVPSAGHTAAPSVVSAASASPAAVSGNTSNLSVLGADPLDSESQLTYTWSVASAPAAVPLPSFLANGTNAAKNTAVTFYQAGTYTFKAFITDTGGLWTTSTTTVTVNQIPTGLTVYPSAATISGNGTAQFNVTATDQFGQPIVTLPTVSWAVTSGGGSVSQSGLYTAPATGTLATVTASIGAAQASATVGVLTPPWSSQDIGPVAIPGQAYDSSGTYTLEGSGSDIGSGSDQFQFTYQSLSGDGDITARLVSQTNTSSSAKSGIMIRNALDASNTFAMLAINPGSGGVFEYRSVKARSTVSSAFSATTTPAWVRLVRSGSTLTGYTSADDIQWTAQGSVSISMNATVYVGLEVCSNNNSALDTATFDNVAVSQVSIASAAASGSNPVQTTAAALSVQAADPMGESNLTYTWAATAIPVGAASPTFSVNSCNAAKSTVATFSSAGLYSFTVTVSDPAGLSVVSTTTVSVDSALTSISMAPPSAACAVGGSLNFGASPLDQFGQDMGLPAGLAWAVTGSGNSISAGALTAGNVAGQFTISATSGAVAGIASLTVNSLVAGRYVFYNNSAFDGSDPTADPRDDRAIAPDKQALLPGKTATFANYTSYARGINGIMVDVAGLPGNLSASDFAFLAGTSSNPSTWAAAPAPSAIVVRPGSGAGGSSRVELTWPDGAIRNQWLQITLLADAASGLASPDVFCFGNLVGSTGQPPQGGTFTVSAADVTSARNDPHTFLNPADLTDVNDFNRDGRVDALDQLIARMSANASLSVLSPTPPAPAPSPSTIHSAAGLLARRRRLA